MYNLSLQHVIRNLGLNLVLIVLRNIKALLEPSEYAKWVCTRKMNDVLFLYVPGDKSVTNKQHHQGLSSIDHNTHRLLIYHPLLKQKYYSKVPLNESILNTVSSCSNIPGFDCLPRYFYKL